MALNFTKFILEEFWEINPQNMEVGTSLLGTQQIVATLADKWTAQIKVRIKVSELSAFRAWRTARRGRLITDDMGPVRELAGSSDGLSLGPIVLHSDGTPHSDGTGYSQGWVLAADAPVRATRLTVLAPGVTDEFGPGKFFGLGQRLYQIINLFSTTATQTTFDFWPPLHAAAAAGDGGNWLPTSPMRLAADDDGAITDNATGAIDVTLNLIEVL